VAVLGRIIAGSETFWSDARRCQAIVLLQDRADQIEGNHRSLLLWTTLKVMLPRNPPPKSFHRLLDAFKSSRHIHHLVKLRLVAGAQFSLGWVRKWTPQLDFNAISKGFPP
jgi:hypothetical protein